MHLHGHNQPVLHTLLEPYNDKTNLRSHPIHNCLGDYLTALDWEEVFDHEQSLLNLTLSQLKQMDGVALVGEPCNRAGVVSFEVADSHPHDIGTLLDQQGIAVRTGHHCAMPLMAALGISGTIRASFSLYNSTDDVDRLISGIRKALTFV